ncbi:hypothetical protein [Companilactobacillus halodurans]|uniref:Uncharacterized protein n=1 Tax=Companilactobacillus halodurans TaxID=2584183 RepID=A0A5P0ZXG2_9LACO|nr:hypothetical protein [Companilactobacillus halodurans]MQS75539.1 hypothetical protein [Companilactobacillus halodurans]MQS97783.1 hypothetical protein [Companilactobacillus halodurans]
MTLFNSTIQKVSGTVVENRKINKNTNQLVIKLEHLENVPEIGDYYLVSFSKTMGVKNNYQRLTIAQIPDENNLLAFTINKKTFKMALIDSGTKVNVKGPFKNPDQQAS